MYNLEDAYPVSFFMRRKSLKWRVKIVGDAIYNVFHPDSVVDVGCGNADILGYIHSHYTPACLAIEGSKKCTEAISENFLGSWLIQDIRRTFYITDNYSLCMCLEVAEHLEPEFADTLIDNLTRLSDTVLFSAAHEGQGGIYHVNCQGLDYWKEKFGKVHYVFDEKTTCLFRSMLYPWRNKKGIKAYFYNSSVWRKALR